MSYRNWGEFKAQVAAAGVRDEDDVDLASIDEIDDTDLVTMWVNGDEIAVKI